MKKQIFPFFFLLWGTSISLLSSPAHADDVEIYLPASAWKLQTQLNVGLPYNKAWGGSGRSVPLRDHLIRDKYIRPRIKGDIARSQSDFRTRLTYGWSEKLRFTGMIPVVYKAQDSDLRIVSADSTTPYDATLENRIKKTLENLDSQTTTGVGDMELEANYVFEKTISLFSYGSVGLKLPSGSTDDGYGADPIAAGGGHVSLLAGLGFNFFPNISGMTQKVKVDLEGRMKGVRKELDGEEGDYYGGNSIDLLYGISLERSNWYLGGALERQIETGSQVNGAHSNDGGFIDLIEMEVGFGNLSDLEKESQSLPYQMRLGFTTPLRGSNTPQESQFNVSGKFYF